MIVSGVAKMKTGEEFLAGKRALSEKLLHGHQVIVGGRGWGMFILVKLNWINRFSGPGTWDLSFSFGVQQLHIYIVMRVAFRVSRIIFENF